MTGTPISEVSLASIEVTQQFASQIAPLLAPGDVLLLKGNIGAGKTSFARALIHARGVDEDVPSPTFTLVQTYEDDVGEIWHVDLYRLDGVGAADELGLSDAFTTAICLVEWPERLGDAAPKSALTLAFEPQGESGRLVRAFGSSNWETRLKLVFDAMVADA